VSGRVIRKAVPLIIALLLAGCSLPVRSAEASLPTSQCADGYMKAMTHTNFEAMYACMGGDLRHRLEERADARNESPSDLLAWDQAALELGATGRFKLLKERFAPVGYRLWDQEAALLYRFDTVGGDMRMVLLVDHRGYVGGLVGPFYSSG